MFTFCWVFVFSYPGRHKVLVCILLYYLCKLLMNTLHMAYATTDKNLVNAPPETFNCSS